MEALYIDASKLQQRIMQQYLPCENAIIYLIIYATTQYVITCSYLAFRHCHHTLFFIGLCQRNS